MWITFPCGVSCVPKFATVQNTNSVNFLDWLGDPAQCPSMECTSDAEKVAGLGFMFARYIDGATDKGYKFLDPSTETDLFCYDLDDFPIETLRAAFPIWAQHDAVVYSTFKHTPEAPRLRLIVRLDRPIPNYEPEPFKTMYMNAAQVLGLPPNIHSKGRAWFYLVPQHKPGAVPERHRLRGVPLSVDSLAGMRAPVAVHDAVDFATARERPDLGDVKSLAKALKKRKSERLQKLGTALGAALRGEPFAPAGSVHNTMLHLAFELVRAFGELDGAWFGQEYMTKAFEAVGTGASGRSPFDDWTQCVESAIAKHREAKEAAQSRAAALSPAALTDLTPEDTARAEAVAGALVCSYRNNYYVFNPRSNGYAGPYKSPEVPTVFRSLLSGLDGVTELEYRGDAPPAIKGASKLTHQYGNAIKSVHYYALPPEHAYEPEEEAIKVCAYKWMYWPALRHAIVDELFKVLGGDKYGLLEAWLSQFRNLSQPLPALTLVGPPKTWKSQTCQTLSRFWHNKDAPTPCRAGQVLLRFGDSLLTNPVIWSDEQLAKSESGKALPERYRESISERAHQIECKGVAPITLYSATRHVISVNDDEKVFSTEVDAASIEATIERFLVLHVDSEFVNRFESRWAGTPELKRLRSGESMLEHVRWIEENCKHVSTGRFFIDTGTDPEMLRRARFADDTLNYCLLICLESLFAEQMISGAGSCLDRTPLLCDEYGQLRISPARISALWADSKVTAGAAVRKPSPARIGVILTKSGFRLDRNERANKNKYKAWAVDHNTFKSFLSTEGTYTWHEITEACAHIFKRRPIDV